MPATSDELTVEEFQAYARDVASLVSDPHLAEAMDEIADVVDAQTREGFANEADPDGNPWPPWQFREPQYSDDKKTLHASGKLEESTRRGGSEHIEEITDDSLAYGTSVDYAATHQEGATVTTPVPLVARGGGFQLMPGAQLNIPQRQFLGFADETIDKAAGIVSDHVMRQLQEL